MPLQISSWKPSQSTYEHLWDAWCILSVVGIWPRYIEPRLLFTSRYTLPIPSLHPDLDGLRIVHISDLHYSEKSSAHFLDQILKTIMRFQPDLILFSGDLVSYGELKDSSHTLERFLEKLSSIPAFGTWAILGNHDYSQYVTLAEDGTYRISTDHVPAIMRGFNRLFGNRRHDLEDDPTVRTVIDPNRGIEELYSRSGIHLLHNHTVQAGLGSARINITGVGDIMTRQCMPDIAFRGYDRRYAGIVLTHNPDSIDFLSSYPGDLYLSGHTHGGQVNLPWIWKRITPIKNLQYKSGLFDLGGRFLYVNRGLGATFPFRWFAPPEITCLTLVRQGPVTNLVWKENRERESAEPVLASRISTPAVPDIISKDIG